MQIFNLLMVASAISFYIQLQSKLKIVFFFFFLRKVAKIGTIFGL